VFLGPEAKQNMDVAILTITCQRHQPLQPRLMKQVNVHHVYQVVPPLKMMKLIITQLRAKKSTQKCALNALRVALEKDKRLLALRHRIVCVLKTIVLVTMVLKQRAQHVLPMVLIFVRLVPVNIIKLAIPALDALRVALEKDKRLLALRHRIVFVLKTFVLVPMVMKPRAKHVLPTMLIFVRPVNLNITWSRRRVNHGPNAQATSSRLKIPLTRATARVNAGVITLVQTAMSAGGDGADIGPRTIA